MHYKQSKEILEKVKNAKTILLNCHRGPDPDSVGSALSMYQVLIKMGKIVEIICPDDIPAEVRFLPYSDKVKKVDYKTFEFSKYDLFITMDSGSWSMVTGASDIKKPDIDLIVIDHHESNDKFGMINLIVPDLSSCAELMYQVFKDWGIELDKDIAETLFAGILSDTGIFRFAGRQALEIAGDLIKLGADKDKLILELFSKSFNEVKMWGEILSKMELDREHKFAWTAIPLSITNKYGHTDAKSSAATMFGSTVREVNFTLFMLEREGNKLSISLRSRGGYNVAPLAEQLGGGGHKAAAGGEVRDLPFDKAVEKVLETARKYSKQY